MRFVYTINIHLAYIMHFAFEIGTFVHWINGIIQWMRFGAHCIGFQLSRTFIVRIAVVFLSAKFVEVSCCCGFYSIKFVFSDDLHGAVIVIGFFWIVVFWSLFVVLFSAFIGTVRRYGLAIGIAIWSPIIIYASIWITDLVVIQWDWVGIVLIVIIGFIGCLFVEVCHLIDIELDNFSIGFGTFCAEWLPLKWMTGPFHRECRWWDLQRLGDALEGQMGGVREVLEARKFPKDLSRIMVELMMMQSVIRDMAKERDFALGEANKKRSLRKRLTPAKVRQRCARRFHSQIPCIVIRYPRGPGSIETVEVQMKAPSRRERQSLRGFVVVFLYGPAQFVPNENTIEFDPVTQQFTRMYA